MTIARVDLYVVLSLVAEALAGVGSGVEVLLPGDADRGGGGLRVRLVAVDAEPLGRITAPAHPDDLELTISLTAIAGEDATAATRGALLSLVSRVLRAATHRVLARDGHTLSLLEGRTLGVPLPLPHRGGLAASIIVRGSANRPTGDSA